jgi:RNA polymerase sigma-70 factor (sigma-E family)
VVPFLQSHDFDVFVADHYVSLQRTAFLLCGDWHLAEDLVQTTLIKVYSRWRTVRQPDKALSFTRTALTRTFIDWQRKHSSAETPTEDIPDSGTAEDETTRRLALAAALWQLPEMQRVVLVLRFWEDLSIEETARVTRRKPATVRSDALRGLARMRDILGPEREDSFSH